MTFGEPTRQPVQAAGTPRTRALSAALRRAREDAGWGVRELARRLDVSHTLVSQWETGKRVPKLEDVSAVLATFGVTGERREQVLDLARGPAEPNWLAEHSLMSSAGINECERTASAIVDWMPTLIPAPLQTADYARAIIGWKGGLTPAEVDSRVSQRLGRLATITGPRSGRGPADYHPILGEWAVRQRIGGSTVFDAQLDHLLKIAARIPLRVVPIGEEWHPGLVGPFVLFRFAEGSPIVLAEHHRSSVFLYNRSVSGDYEVAAGEILDAALSHTESVELIRRIGRRE